MALPALPPKDNTDWYTHYAALDAAVRNGTDLYKPTVLDIQANGERTTSTYLRGDGTWGIPQGSNAVSTALLSATVFHDGTTGGGTRPPGYARVIWAGGTARPTNMAVGDVWEHAAA